MLKSLTHSLTRNLSFKILLELLSFHDWTKSPVKMTLFSPSWLCFEFLTPLEWQGWRQGTKIWPHHTNCNDFWPSSQRIQDVSVFDWEKCRYGALQIVANFNSQIIVTSRVFCSLVFVTQIYNLLLYLKWKNEAKLTESETCLCLNDPVFVVKAASSDSSDSRWSLVDSKPSNTLVSSFVSSAILVIFPIS